MISISNLLNDSDERGGGLEYMPNSRFLGNVKVVAGRYYLIAFSLKTDTLHMPILMSTYSEDGLIATPIINTVINTTVQLSTYNKVYKSIGVYLYGGYCTQNNSNWRFDVTFGRCGYTSFAYSIEEVIGSSTNPVVQTLAIQDNTGALAPTSPANVTYLAGMSMLQNESYPMIIAPGWTMLADCFGESVVPNLLTGYSPIADANPSWSNGGAYPWLEKALLAVELS